MASTQSVQCFGKKKTGMVYLQRDIRNWLTRKQQPQSHIARYDQKLTYMASTDRWNRKERVSLKSMANLFRSSNQKSYDSR